jgi:plastocyanin
LRRTLLQLPVAIASIIVTSAAWAASIGVTAIDKDGALMADVVMMAIPAGGAAASPAASTAGTPETVVIAQDHLQFSPYVTVVRTGTAIKFPNYDKIEHHVKSFSAAKEFELQVYDKGTPPPVTFDKPGVVVIYCLLHGWMRAYVMVADTPYFAKTDATGLAGLDGLKEGTYEIRAWHPDMGTVKPPLVQTVKVGAGTVLPVTFNFDFVAKKRRSAKLDGNKK